VRESKIKKVSAFLCLIFVAVQVFLGIASIKAATVVDSYVKVDKNISNSRGESGKSVSARVGEELTINYNITSDPVSSSVINGQPQEKRIVLVIDTSGSMDTKDMTGGKKRVDIAISAAKSFIDKFAGKTNVKISVVAFNDVVENVIDFTSDFNTLKSQLNNLSLGGVTNIGDGLRKAYYKLQSQGSSYKKYMVLLTDGQPNFWSINKYDSNYFTSDSNSRSDYRIPNNSDINKGLAYAKLIAKMVGQANINSHMIGFTADIDKSKLDSIASEAAAQTYTARDAEGLTAVYNQIGDQIKNDYTLSNVTFEETFPNDVEVVSSKLPEGFQISGQTVTGILPNIGYILNNGSYTIVNPISFNIVVKFKTIPAASPASLSDISKISYRDYLNNQTNQGYKNFNKVNVTVREAVQRVDKISLDFIGAVEKSSYNLVNGITEDIKVSYKVTPKPINFYSVAPEDYDKEKYIVVVIDTSGSMKWELNRNQDAATESASRLGVLKTTLNSSSGNGFINKLEGMGNVNVGMVYYSDSAKLGNDVSDLSNTKIRNSKGEIQDFAKMSDQGQVSALKNQISTLDAEGGTNIGDGLRRAYWLLDKVNKDVKKYVVLMTDGDPNMYSYESRETGFLGNARSVEYLYEDGLANKIGSNTYFDWEDYGLGYSKKMAEVIKQNIVSQYVIGFTKEISDDKLKAIAASAGVTAKKAATPEDLSSLYTEIAGEIKKDLPIKDLTFTATIPYGLQVKALMKDGATLKKEDGSTQGDYIVENKVDSSNNPYQIISVKPDKIGTITYKLNADKTYFEASQIHFDIMLNATKDGSYKINKDTTYLNFSDLNKTVTQKNADNDVTFTVTKQSSRIISHGLFQDRNNRSVADSLILGSSIDSPNAMHVKAGILVEANYNNTAVLINLGQRNRAKLSNSGVVNFKIYKVRNINGTDTYEDITTDPKPTVAPNPVNVGTDGTTTATVTLNSTGKYLIVYSFELQVQSTGITFTNTASVDGIPSYLNLKIMNQSELPDLF
jgi:Mg-chelatase subunit ChlD